jgi:hypothetical protein
VGYFDAFYFSLNSKRYKGDMFSLAFVGNDGFAGVVSSNLGLFNVFIFVGNVSVLDLASRD